jgi:hypothetical protein
MQGRQGGQRGGACTDNAYVELAVTAFDNGISGAFGLCHDCLLSHSDVVKQGSMVCFVGSMDTREKKEF